MSNKNMPTKSQYVLLITDGPCYSRIDHASTDKKPRLDLASVRQHFCDAIEHQEEESFRITVGSPCLNVRNPDQSIDIEPMLFSPIPVSLLILNWRNEPANPSGVSIIGKVTGVVNYSIQLPSNYRYDSAYCVIKPGDIVQLSYHLEHCTGGIVRVDLARILEHRPPLINSLSEIVREYVAADSGRCHQQRGRAIYKAAHTELDAPVGYDEDMFYEI